MRLMLWMTVVRACLAWDNVTQVEAVLSSACPCMGVRYWAVGLFGGTFDVQAIKTLLG